jgi:uncharacterized metal-binding protein YceD (DUF177 family)
MTPEFSRPLALGRIGAQGREETVTADAAECAALAARFGLEAIAALSCRFALRFGQGRGEGGRLHAEGELHAVVTQRCVATLDPFPATIDETFSIIFVPPELLREDVDPEGPDELPIEGDAIDLGEAAAEQLALSLDPYPRKPGLAEAEAEPSRPSPFAALAKLKRP